MNSILAMPTRSNLNQNFSNEADESINFENTAEE
jgi:hypothetical protein